MPHTEFKDLVPEGSSRMYEATLKDYAGDPVPLAAVASITCTLRDLSSDQIVNSRNDQSVLNTNGGTLHASSGLFQMVFGPDDTVAIGSTRQQQRRATFKVVYSSGRENHEVIFTVYNLADV